MPAHSEADYLAAIQALMPRGAAWPTDREAVQTAVLAALARAFAQEDQAAVDLLADAFPATAGGLLPEWEATLGLPDPCEGADQTLQQRRAQVVARLAGQGGQSVPYLQKVAADLGYPGVAIQEFAPARAGCSSAGDPCCDDRWLDVFQVTVPTLRVFWASAGVSAAGEPLWAIETNSIMCVIDALKPAHTLALYATLNSLETEDAVTLITEDGDALVVE